MTFLQGTIYAKRVVLGGRLISCVRQSELSSSASIENEEKLKENASVSLGILGNSIRGGGSTEHRSTNESETKKKISQDKIDWTAYGGNKNYASEYENHIHRFPTCNADGYLCFQPCRVAKVPR